MQEQAPGKRIAYFTTLLSFTAAFKEIRYSFDSEALDRQFPFEPGEGSGWRGWTPTICSSRFLPARSSLR